MDKTMVLIASIFSSITLLAMIVPFWYYAVYRRVAKDNIWRDGRKFAVNFQGSVIAILVAMVAAYLSPNLLGTADGRAYGSLMFGIIILVVAALNYLTVIYFDTWAHKYLKPIYIAPMIAATGLLIYGIVWLSGETMLWRAKHAFLLIAVITMGRTEYAFLRNNNWRFLPSKPR